MSSSFGKIFRVSTFGESHGGAVGVIIDGCPPKLKIDINLIQNELDRRRPGQSDITTPRNEEDKIEILSGIKPKTLKRPSAKAPIKTKPSAALTIDALRLCLLIAIDTD